MVSGIQPCSFLLLLACKFEDSSAKLTFLSIYSTVYPLITIFAAMFFGLGSLIFRYQVLYVYTPSYETGGQFFHNFVFEKLILGFTLHQCTMFGFFILKGAVAASMLVLLPILACTIAFQWYCIRKFDVYANGWSAVLQDDSPPVKDISCEWKDVEAGAGAGAGAGAAADGEEATRSTATLDDARIDISKSSLLHESLGSLGSTSSLAVKQENKKKSSLKPVPATSQSDLDGDEFGDEYDPQTYVHPVFHRPLQQLWLPKDTKAVLKYILDV